MRHGFRNTPAAADTIRAAASKAARTAPPNSMELSAADPSAAAGIYSLKFPLPGPIPSRKSDHAASRQNSISAKAAPMRALCSLMQRNSSYTMPRAAPVSTAAAASISCTLTGYRIRFNETV